MVKKEINNEGTACDSCRIRLGNWSVIFERFSTIRLPDLDYNETAKVVSKDADKMTFQTAKRTAVVPIGTHTKDLKMGECFRVSSVTLGGSGKILNKIDCSPKKLQPCQ